MRKRNSSVCLNAWKTWVKGEDGFQLSMICRQLKLESLDRNQTRQKLGFQKEFY